VPDPGEQQLLLSDWLVLCVVCEEPTHGFAVAGLFPVKVAAIAVAPAGAVAVPRQLGALPVPLMVPRVAGRWVGSEG
jgi:hypothetical protein